MNIRWMSAIAERDANRKAASLSDAAFHENIAAHQPAKLLAERQSKSGAAVFACARVVGDGEFLEKARDLVRSDSDAGIDNVDHKFIRSVARQAFRNKFNPAVLRELHGVIDQ